MCSEINDTFVRELELDLLNDSLRLYQKFQGDVSCVVWDASIVLSKYLEQLCNNERNYLKGLNVLELGSGVGCVGLTASCLGANVLLTDLPEVLTLLDKNICENNHLFKKFKGTANSQQLAWGENVKFNIKFEKILLADCIYYEESVEPLLYTLRNLGDANTEILIAQEMRESEIQKVNWLTFLKGLKHHFYVQQIPITEQSNMYCSEDILLFKAYKKSGIV